MPVLTLWGSSAPRQRHQDRRGRFAYLQYAAQCSRGISRSSIEGACVRLRHQWPRRRCGRGVRYRRIFSPYPEGEVRLGPDDTGAARVSGSDSQFAVDLLNRLTPGFDPKKIIHRASHQEPAAEINKGMRNLRQRHIRLEVIARADDQGQAYWSNDLADAPKAVGGTHARGPQVRGPDFRGVRTDYGKAAVGKEKGYC